MNRWLRRLVYLLIALLWLLIMVFPIFAFSLATNGEMNWGQEGGRQVRLFLLQEKDAEGVGLQISRPQTDTPTCVNTRVTYFMWTGTGQNNEYCACMDGTTCKVDE